MKYSLYYYHRHYKALRRCPDKYFQSNDIAELKVFADNLRQFGDRRDFGEPMLQFLIIDNKKEKIECIYET